MSCACDSLRKFLLSVLRTADPVDNSLSIIKVQGIRAETTDDTVLETLISGSVCLSATFFRRSVTQLSTDVLFVCAKSQVLGLTCPALLVDGKCVSVEISNEQLPVDLKPETLVDKMDLFTTGVFSDIGLFVASTPNPRTSHYCCSETPRSMLTFDGPRTPMLPSARWDEDRRTPLTDGVFTFSGTGRRPRFDRRPSVRATREEARTEDVQRTPAPIDREELLSPYIPANIGLSPASMIQGYLSESLCLPCNSLTHSMPKCPHGVFVCPNCLQPDHNGNKCPEKCRFCGSRHEGVSIMRCIKETAGKIRRHEALNFEIGTVPLFIRKQSAPSDSRPNNIFGRTVWINNIPAEVSNTQLVASIEDTGVKVKALDRHDRWAYLELDSLANAHRIVRNPLCIQGHLLSVQFRKVVSKLT